ncbi:MAG: hypothetical protein IPJ71_14940 [Bdellovibrionales bacterium]|nr:hypothetical protein [Bdellovibrionales bacterium]
MIFGILLFLVLFQNCDLIELLKKNGNGGGYTGMKNDDYAEANIDGLYGPFDPSHSPFELPSSERDRNPVPESQSRTYFRFSEVKTCPNANRISELAVSSLIFSVGDIPKLSHIDCGALSVGPQGLLNPVISSYDPWYIALGEEIFQYVSDPLSREDFPYTHVLCRQIQNIDSTGTDYGIDVVVQKFRGNFIGQFIKGSQIAEGRGIRKITDLGSLERHQSTTDLSFRSDSFELRIKTFVGRPSGSMSAQLRTLFDDAVVDLPAMTCWVQNQPL